MARDPGPICRVQTAVGLVLVLSLAAGRGAVGQGPAAAPAVAAAEGGAAAVVTALRRQDFTGALGLVEDALAESSTASPQVPREIATLEVLKAQALYGLGRPEEAIGALARFAAEDAGSGTVVSPAVDWNALTVLADSQMALDRWDAALASLVRARSLLLADRAGDPRQTSINAATTLGKIGTARARLGDWPGARAAFEEQIGVLADQPDEGGPYLAAAHNGLGLVADNGGDHAAAATHYAIAARIYETTFGLDHPYTKRALTTLGRVNARMGNAAEADAIAARLATVDAVPRSISPTLSETPRPDPPAAAVPAGPVPWPVAAAAVAAVLLVLMGVSGFLRRGAAARDRAGGDEGR